MKSTNFIVSAAVVIAATFNFGVQGFPKPQLNINLGPSNILSLDPLGGLFGRPTSESPNSPHGLNLDPLGILFGKPTSESPISPNDPWLHTITPTVGPTIPTPSPIVTPNRSTQSPVVDQTPVPASTQPNVALCAQNCKGTPEYNPVCGTNGVMYNNPGQLICARNCGINVAQLRTGRCPTPPPTVTPNLPTPAPVTVIPDAVLRCAYSCMLTQEYNPVCGSDGVTYRNEGLLICTRNCGISVTQRSVGRCIIEDPFSIDPRIGRD